MKVRGNRLRAAGPALCLVLLAAGFDLGAQSRFSMLHSRARDLASRGAVGDAVPYLEEMVRLQPYNERALFLLASALLHRRDLSAEPYRRGCRRAADLLRQAATMHARVSSRGQELGLRYLYLGLALWYGGDSRAALAAFQAAYRADFERRDAVFNQLAIHEELGQEAEAEVVRREIRKLSKDPGLDD